MSETPWFHEGLPFKCTQCGNCCTGSPGYVWVNKAEIEALAARLGMNVEDFEARHVRKVGIRKCLLERANGDCVLFDNKTRMCTVYDVRPRQCRTWPFWRSNVRSAKNWEQTCRVCPGSGNGPLVPLDAILEQIASVRV